MIRKILMLLAVVAFLAAISGCNTVRGAGEGAAEGAKKDWDEAKKTDGWMRKNLW